MAQVVVAGQGHGQAQAQAHLAGRGRKEEVERGSVTNSPAKGNGRPLSIFMMSDRVDSLTWPQVKLKLKLKLAQGRRGRGGGEDAGKTEGTSCQGIHFLLCFSSHLT